MADSIETFYFCKFIIFIEKHSAVCNCIEINMYLLKVCCIWIFYMIMHENMINLLITLF